MPSQPRAITILKWFEVKDKGRRLRKVISTRVRDPLSDRLAVPDRSSQDSPLICRSSLSILVQYCCYLSSFCLEIVLKWQPQKFTNNATHLEKVSKGRTETSRLLIAEVL